MESILEESKEFFLEQVANFRVPPTQSKGVEENSASDVSIGARIRPLLAHEINDGLIAGVSADEGHAHVHELRRKISGQPAVTSSSFRLDKVYGPINTSQDVYCDLVAPLIPFSWDGGVSTLFAYGQTGSGKTYTVSELEKLAAAELMSGKFEGNRDIYMCVFELAGNMAYDLLNDRRRISVLEDSFGESQLVGVIEHKPKTANELLNLIDHSMAFRASAPTLKNDSSSRSHAVCRIRIANKDVPSVPDGLLFLVDLAGSEAASDSKAHSTDRMKETRDINSSLAILKDCIRGRALWSIGASARIGPKKPRSVHVPYRSSVLTKVLKHVFDIKGDRSCQTAVLACINPSAADVGPSKNTLRYAELLRVPVPKTKPPVYSPAIPSTWSNQQARAWIDNNSGIPPVSSALLAPTETGLQLLKLPKGAFLARCLAHLDTTPERARAFYDKFWRLHIDSRAAKPAEAEVDPTYLAPTREQPSGSFRDRLRPGMFVRSRKRNQRDAMPLVMVLCPEGAFEERRGGDGKGTEGGRGYVCAAVTPSVMVDAYELKMERQMVLGLEEMEEEVVMEWDVASRYWYVVI